ncbi:MAG: TraB/GumN family protein [Hyphomonas sp.]
MRKLTRNCALLATSLLMLGLSACKDDADKPETESAGQVAVESEATSTDLSLEELRDYIASQEALSEEALRKAKASSGPGAPALWSLKDEDTTIHMFGTVHLLRPEIDWLTPEIESALDQADTIVFEADVSSEAAAKEMMQFVSEKAMLTGGTRLNDLLSDAEETVVAEALADVDMSLELVQTLQPWFASVTLQQMKMVSDGFDPESGVEFVIQSRAPEKTYQFLETVDQQLGRMASLSEDEQVNFLVLSAGSSADSAELLDDLVAEWSDGDVEGLGMLIGDAEAFGSTEVYEALLKSRNEDWIPQIEGMLDTPGNVFVAVGAAHLAGDDSVVAMLRARGHAVTGP